MKKSLPVADPTTLTREDLIELVIALSARVGELEEMLNKNSSNSSKPPSSDGLAKKTQSLREPSGKKPGGQAGHKGSTLRQAETPTETIQHPLPTQCTRCNRPLPQDGAYLKACRQVFEIPVMHGDIIEHQIFEQQCQCGALVCSAFPADVTEPVQYGPNLRALGVHLHVGQLLPFARTAQLIGELFNFQVSPGSIASWVVQASTTLQDTADVIAEQSMQAALAHADESGLRVEGSLYRSTWYFAKTFGDIGARLLGPLLESRLHPCVVQCPFTARVAVRAGKHW